VGPVRFERRPIIVNDGEIMVGRRGKNAAGPTLQFSAPKRERMGRESFSGCRNGIQELNAMDVA